jgi:hypothetical protein
MYTTMPTTKFTDLATYLRSKGLKVQEVSGWKTRSSNWSRSFTPKGVVCHHTAGPTGNGNYPSYNTVLNGRKGLAGPLSQFGLGRDGTVIIFGAHRANHAGVGGPLNGIPEDSANAYMWGIEAENSGSQAWPAVQLQAYYRLVAALATYPKAPFRVSMAIGHKEWAPGRKPDPSFSMSAFRTQVQKAINAGSGGGGTAKPPADTEKPTTTAKVDFLGNPKWGAGPYDGRWTRGPVPRHPLHLDIVYHAIGWELGSRKESLDSFELAHRAKVVAELQHLARLKGARPQRTIVNLVKQVQTLWLGYNSHHKFYGLFDRGLFDLFVKRQGWDFWDGARSDNAIK